MLYTVCKVERFVLNHY